MSEREIVNWDSHVHVLEEEYRQSLEARLERIYRLHDQNIIDIVDLPLILYKLQTQIRQEETRVNPRGPSAIDQEDYLGRTKSYLIFIEVEDF